MTAWLAESHQMIRRRDNGPGFEYFREREEQPGKIQHGEKDNVDDSGRRRARDKRADQISKQFPDTEQHNSTNI